MLNFASLFNQFRSQSNNGLENLLDSSQTSMERLLDQESFIGEYKSNNPKVINFMKYDKYQELLEFVTVVGPANDKKRSFKYPQTACELLSIDNANAIELFLPQSPIIFKDKILKEVEVEVEIEVEDEIQEEQKSIENQVQSEVIEKTVITDNQQVAKEVQQVKEIVAQKQGQIIVIVNEVLDVEDNLVAKVEAEEEKIEENQTKQEIKEITQKVKENIQEIKEIEAAPLVPERKTKKIIKKQMKTVQQIITREGKPLIERLMSYFDGEVNYTLAGYVCKILTTIFNKKPVEFLKYFFSGNVAQKVLNHAQSRSVGDLLLKILTNQINNSLEERKNFFQLMLKKISEYNEIHIMSNVSTYVSEIIEKIAANLKSPNKIIEFNTVFFSLDVITQVIRNVMSQNQTVSVYNAPILFTYLTNVPFILPEDETVIEQFRQLLDLFIQKSLEKLQIQNRTRPKLGTGRIKIVQILKHILKENILETRQIIAKKSQFFKIMINLVRQYEMNNLLHNEIIKIIDIALTDDSNSGLNQSILKDDILLHFISEQAAEDRKIKAGQSIYKFRKGYIAHIINLCIRLKELAEKNQTIKSLIQGTQFTNVYENFIQKEVFNSRKTLAGFSMRRDIKHQIMFQKDDIISNYMTFLQNCPSPVFEQQVDHVNIEHPDLVEQLQKQLQENLVVRPRQQIEELSNQKMPDEVSPEAEIITPPTFFMMHLDYNVDDLLADL